MGCIKASDYEELTGGSGVILGTYSGVNASGDCIESCGVCCVAGCESDFTNVGSCEGTIYTEECEDWCEYWNGWFYGGTLENSAKYCYESISDGEWSGSTESYGWCPNMSGCFDGQYDCASFTTTNKGYTKYFDVDDPAGFVSGGNAATATDFDPCGGSYPCTKKIYESKTTSILVDKNPYSYYGLQCYYAAQSLGIGGMWNNNISSEWGGYDLGYLWENLSIGCPNGTGALDFGIFYNVYGEGAYVNSNESCCSGIADTPRSDKIHIFRITGVSAKEVTFQSGEWNVCIVTFNGGIPEYGAYSTNYPWDFDRCDCGDNIETATGVYVSDVEFGVGRQHDYKIYLCSAESSSLEDYTDYVCEKPMPFFSPFEIDTIDWNALGTYNLFFQYPGYVMGLGGPYSLTYEDYDNNYRSKTITPCFTAGHIRNGYNPETRCPPCDTLNAIVGNFVSSSGNFYARANSAGLQYSFSNPIGTFTMPSMPEFLPSPELEGGVNITYSCNDTIGQSGCLENGIWHSGQTCESFDCNA